MALNSSLSIKTTEMHTGGEPLRIVESGYPEIKGDTILEKRRYAKENLDHLRKLLMFEPRGHYDMYGALPVKATTANVDLAVLFIHNEGYSTMCGHAVIALGRYAIDKGLVKNPTSPETEVKIQCPCGVVKAFTEYDGITKRTGKVRFHSVPAFAFALDVSLSVPGYGGVKVDIGYGGAFYAIIPGSCLGIDVRKSPTTEVVKAATAVSEAARKVVKLTHPDNPDLAFLYGTIVTDGADAYSQQPTANTCVFAASEVDRSPCGSGVTARIAVQFARRHIGLNQTRVFESGPTSSRFVGQVVEETKCGDFPAVIVEVSGHGYYSGSAEFTVEENDDLKQGFLLR